MVHVGGMKYYKKLTLQWTFSCLTFLTVCLSLSGEVHPVLHVQSLLNSVDAVSISEEAKDSCQCAGTPKWTVGLRQAHAGLHPSPIPAVSDACEQVLQTYSVSVANFSSCLAMNARPITVCQYCNNEYLQMKDLFQNISVGSGSSCDTELLNRDHLLVVQSLAKHADWFWATAQCQHCYSADGLTLCNDTVEFFQHLDQVTKCINNTEFIVDGVTVVKNQSEVCENCRTVYLNLNAFYETLNTKYNNRLCMDIMDQMNITRHLWSSQYKCSILNVEGLPVLLTSLGFLLLPVIYYCGNRFVAIAKDTKLVQQKRMSFVQTSYSSITGSLQR